MLLSSCDHIAGKSFSCHRWLSLPQEIDIVLVTLHRDLSFKEENDMTFRVSQTLSANAGSGVTFKTAIIRRPMDLLFLAFFSISILYGFLFSLPEGLGVPVSADSPWPPLRALHGWAVAEEPAHLNPPPNLIAATLFDGFFQAPILLFIVVGLIRQRPWLVPIGLIYAGAGTTNMFFYFVQTFLGDHPPPNLGYYLVFNLPWLIAPIALGCRVLFNKDLQL
jgi:hypothetical protein